MNVSKDKDISTEEYYKQLFSKINVWIKRQDEEVLNDNEGPNVNSVDISIPKKGEGLKGVIKGID